MMKYKMIIERIDKDDNSNIISEITVDKTNIINKYHETKFIYSGFWVDVNEDENKLCDKHKLHGEVGSWSAHPFLIVIYKILHKQMECWIDELRWDY